MAAAWLSGCAAWAVAGILAASAAAGPRTEILSVSPTGGPSNAGSTRPDVSADGRYVVFDSRASNLVKGDDNGKRDVFLSDLSSGRTQIISLNRKGGAADRSSTGPSISANGRYVAFTSAASNLVAKDAPVEERMRNIYVRDLKREKTTLLTVGRGGEAADEVSLEATISADGKAVAFSSFASNLVEADTNDNPDVFAVELSGAAIERVSVDTAGEQGNDASRSPSISADGRYVAFDSLADNLGGPEGGVLFDALVRDRTAGTTESVAIDRSDAPVDGVEPAISNDGRYVAFSTFENEILVRDRQTATTSLASVANVDGEQENVITAKPAISGDGRYVAFISAQNLTGDAKSCCFHVFVRDTASAVTEHVDHTHPAQTTDASRVAISADGRFAAFVALSKPKAKGARAQPEIFVRGPSR